MFTFIVVGIRDIRGLLRDHIGLNRFNYIFHSVQDHVSIVISITAVVGMLIGSLVEVTSAISVSVRVSMVA